MLTITLKLAFMTLKYCSSKALFPQHMTVLMQHCQKCFSLLIQKLEGHSDRRVKLSFTVYEIPRIFNFLFFKTTSFCVLPSRRITLPCKTTQPELKDLQVADQTFRSSLSRADVRSASTNRKQQLHILV